MMAVPTEAPHNVMKHISLRSFSLSLCTAAVLSLCAVALVVSAVAQDAPRVPVTRPPAVKKHLYPEISQAQADIDAAVAEARRTHKRVLLDFGGDWCGDCQVLDIYFGQPENAALLSKYFIKVNINIGHMDANKELAARYGVPLQGVPALAVLDSHGKLLYAQKKEFSDMRYMESSSVTEFLKKWKS